MATTSTNPAPKKRVRPKRRSNRGMVLVFLSPLLAVYGLYFVYGFIFLARTSVQRVGISFIDPISVGFDNYRLLAENDVFRRAIINNLLFAFAGIIAALTIGFFIAMAISAGAKPKRLLQVVFLVPALMPLSLVATIFGSMLQERFGVLNETLRAVGLDSLAQPWLTDPGFAFGTVAVLFCYLIGLPILYYTADLSALPMEPIEAALIDGAGTFRIMRSIIFPMMGSTHVTVILALLLGSFRSLEQVLFTTQGGPAGRTEIVGTFLYRFTTDPGKLTGFVSAAAVVVLFIALIVTLVQLAITRPWKEGR